MKIQKNHHKPMIFLKSSTFHQLNFFKNLNSTRFGCVYFVKVAFTLKIDLPKLKPPKLKKYFTYTLTISE